MLSMSAVDGPVLPPCVLPEVAELLPIPDGVYCAKVMPKVPTRARKRLAVVGIVKGV